MQIFPKKNCFQRTNIFSTKFKRKRGRGISVVGKCAPLSAKNVRARNATKCGECVVCVCVCRRGVVKEGVDTERRGSGWNTSLAYLCLYVCVYVCVCRADLVHTLFSSSPPSVIFWNCRDIIVRLRRCGKGKEEREKKEKEKEIWIL